MPKKRILVICPGRGSYTKDTLGYLRNSQWPELAELDRRRKAEGLPSLTQLDNEQTFKPALHMAGEHASPLIYACAASDFFNLDRNQYEVVAILGNSMGWYITLG